MKSGNAAKTALWIALGLIANAAVAQEPTQPKAEKAPAKAEELPVVPVKELSPEKEAAAKEEPKEAVKLEEVIVTSTKRPMALRDIPQSITSLSGDDLERRGAQNLQDIIKLVPGVNMVNDLVAPRVTVRGISSSINTSPTTGAIFGNISFADAYLPAATLDANPFDLESVEILKGPQGTLFGSSNLNGAIRYVPKAPALGVWETKYYGQYTHIDTGEWAPSYGAVVNMPLGRDDLAVRAIAFVREQPGYVDIPKLGIEDSNQVHQRGVRGIVAFKPGDFDLSFSYAYQRSHSDNIPGTDNQEGDEVDRNELRLSPQTQEYNFADLSLGYDFGWAKLVSESSSVNKRSNNFLEATQALITGSPTILGSQRADALSHTYCEELRLSSPEDAAADWHWLVGALMWKEIEHIDVAINLDALTPLPVSLPLGLLPLGFFNDQGPVLVRAITHAAAREYALFGEVTRRFFSRLDVTLGGRFYRTLSGGTNDVTGIATATQGTFDPTSPDRAHIEGEIPEHGFNPKVAVSMHWTKNVMTYAAVSRGYRVGGVQYGVAVVPSPQSPMPTTFKSDTIWNYEGGVRTEWFHRALRFDLTGFREDWKDPQYYTLDSSGTVKYLTNVGGVRSTGGEAAIQFITPWHILFTTTAAYAKTVTTIPFTAPNGSTAQPGTPWPYSPRWQTASTIAYRANLGNWTLNSGVTYTFMGQAINDLADKLPVYNWRQLDVQAGIGNATLRWLPEVELSLNNALNDQGIAGLNYNQTTRQLWGVSYIQPRTVNLRLVGHF